jgi:hypothetical protein
MTETPDDLADRVTQFQCMELPGQPQMAHMGTTYLVMDLWRALRAERERAEKAEAQRDTAYRAGWLACHAEVRRNMPATVRDPIGASPNEYGHFHGVMDYVKAIMALTPPDAAPGDAP